VIGKAREGGVTEARLQRIRAILRQACDDILKLD